MEGIKRPHLLVAGSSLAIFLALITVVVGCAATTPASKLPGRYTASYDVASETIYLRPDGTFTQSISLQSGGKTLQAQGQWSYDSYLDSVVFDEHYLAIVDAFGRLNKNFHSNGTTGTPLKEFPFRLGGDESPVTYIKQK